MIEKIRTFVREAGPEITVFTLVPSLTILYVVIHQTYLAIHAWLPVAEKLASLR
jgi:hypothetical protein